MLTFIACIALLDLGVGFYLGTRWTMPQTKRGPDLIQSDIAAVQIAPEVAEAPFANPVADLSIELPRERLAENLPNSATDLNTDSAVNSPAAAKHAAVSHSPNSWQAAAQTAWTDIATLRERIRYAQSANDKQLVRDIAAEIRVRMLRWQKQMQGLLAKLSDKCTQDSTAEQDIMTAELCLAQIETLETNLALLDWSEPAEALLNKMQKELAAINRLLPVAA